MRPLAPLGAGVTLLSGGLWDLRRLRRSIAAAGACWCCCSDCCAVIPSMMPAPGEREQLASMSATPEQQRHERYPSGQH
jgi:hypothetical protein